MLTTVMSSRVPERIRARIHRLEHVGPALMPTWAYRELPASLALILACFYMVGASRVSPVALVLCKIALAGMPLLAFYAGGVYVYQDRIAECWWWSRARRPWRYRRQILTGADLQRQLAPEATLLDIVCRVQRQCAGLRRQRSLREGWLPLDVAGLDDLEWDLVSALLDSVPARAAVRAASGDELLRDAVAVPAEHLEAVDAEVAAALLRLRSLGVVAARISGRLYALDRQVLADARRAELAARLSALRASRPSHAPLGDWLAGTSAVEQFLAEPTTRPVSETTADARLEVRPASHPVQLSEGHNGRLGNNVEC
ncbi:hypothetical protein AB0M43_36280 [Longispora sp. NPDC051575]|uniref:hypothetical protein n=1 Tax=Longispora sp. NPDC051575 TaxID=3154943 RepID=UPI00343E78E1